MLFDGPSGAVVRGRNAEAVGRQLEAASRFRDGQLGRVSGPGRLEKNVSGRRARQVLIGVELHK